MFVHSDTPKKPCTQLYSILANKGPEAFQRAESTLSRQLSNAEKESLIKITEKNSKTLTLEEMAAENKNLLKAGFKEDEIDRLRLKGVLSNSVVKEAIPRPKSVHLVEAELVPADKELIKAVKEGKEKQYFFTQDGKVYFADNAKLPTTSDNLIFVKIPGETGSAMVKEAGTFSYNPKTKNFTLNSKVSLDLAETESKELASQIKNIGSIEGLPVRTLGEGISHSKLINCLDVLSGQFKGKNFVADKMIGDNLVTTSAIIASEMGGANRLGTQKGQEVIVSDLIGTNINSAVGSVIGKHIVLSNASLLSSITTRSAVGLGMIEVQKNVYKNVMTEEADKTADKIAQFDRAHFAGRLLVNHYFDKFIVHQLPSIVFNMCKKNSSAQIFISPRAVRLYERYGSAVLYYGLRKSIIDE